MRLISILVLMLLSLEAHSHGGGAKGVFEFDANKSMEWNIGGQLTTEEFHCARCHAPRSAADPESFDVSGVLSGFHGPNITQDPNTGIGEWSIEDIEFFLMTGGTPDGDFVGGEMGDIIKKTNVLSSSERHAMAVYLKSLAPAANTMLHHGGVHGDHPAEAAD